MDYEIIIEAAADDDIQKQIFEDQLTYIIKQCLSEVEDSEKGDHLSPSLY